MPIFWALEKETKLSKNATKEFSVFWQSKRWTVFSRSFWLTKIFRQSERRSYLQPGYRVHIRQRWRQTKNIWWGGGIYLHPKIWTSLSLNGISTLIFYIEGISPTKTNLTKKNKAQIWRLHWRQHRYNWRHHQIIRRRYHRRTRRHQNWLRWKDYCRINLWKKRQKAHRWQITFRD